MRKILVLIMLVALTLATFAQTSEVRSIGSFKGVRASEDIDVYLKKGDKESAKVEATGVSLSEVVTEISGTYLKVHMRNGSYREQKTVKVYVVYKTLDRISASAAANIFSEGTINSDQLEISVSSGASVEVTLASTSLSVETSSSGDAVLEGKVTAMNVETSSGGTVDAYKVNSENVTVNANSGGVAKVSVSKGLVANANSGGTIRYRGNPTKTMTSANSGGSVKKSN
jgi:hypothetical protein